MDPDALDLTFGPQPGDYLSHNRARGVATPPRGPLAGRGRPKPYVSETASVPPPPTAF